MDFKGLIFISGKGGTGKTTFATSLSHFLGKQGKKVLLVELASRSSVSGLLNKPFDNLGYQPRTTGLGFDICLLRGVDCLVDYIGQVMGVEKIAKKIFETSIIRSLVNVAPGLNDLALLGKLTSHLTQHGPGFDYDHIVVDAPSTGSFYSLLSAPRVLGQSVSRGPLKKQSESIESVLRDPGKVQYFIMSLYEEFAIDELEDTLGYLNDSVGEQIHVIANRYYFLESSRSKDENWKNFIEQKSQQVAEQSRRIGELWNSVFSVDLMTIPLREWLDQSDGELLRKL